MASENLTKVLYPNDRLTQGKQLRLEQQYFFVSCSLQDMLRLHLRAGDPLERFHEHFVAQLNDTHPSIAVAELMRLLVDEHLMDWDTAWHVTEADVRRTRTTRCWPKRSNSGPLPLFGALLPRHLEIIFEINRRFLDEVRIRYPNDDERVTRVSLIDERGREVRPHGAPGERRQPRDQRRRRAAHRAPQAGRPQRLLRSLSGAIPQHDQRCDAETLDGPVQSGPHAA